MHPCAGELAVPALGLSLLRVPSRRTRQRPPSEHGAGARTTLGLACSAPRGRGLGAAMGLVLGSDLARCRPSRKLGTRRHAGREARGGPEACPEGCSAWESPPSGLVKWLLEEGQAIVFLKSSHWLKEGRLEGPRAGTPAEPPAPARANAAGWVGAGQSGKHPRRAMPGGSGEGGPKAHVRSEVCVHGCRRNGMEEPALAEPLTPLDEPGSLMAGGEAVGSAWRAAPNGCHQLGGLWGDHQLPDQPLAACPPPPAAPFPCFVLFWGER